MVKSFHVVWVVLAGVALGILVYALTTRNPRATGQPQANLPVAASWIEVPGGRFESFAEESEVIVETFWIHRTEVTNSEYARFVSECPMGSNCGPEGLPSYWNDGAYLSSHADFPVVYVSWEDARAFCLWVGARLPSSEEWERAAGGPDGFAYPTGSIPDPSTANILGSDHSKKKEAEKEIPTWAVTDERYLRDRSPGGALGMAGNVSEWTATRSKKEPRLRRVAGGSWDSWKFSDGRADRRLDKEPTDRSNSLGFRCARSR